MLKTTLLRTRPGQAVTMWTLAALVAVSASGCFNTYELEKEEFAELQRPDEIPKVVESREGQEVLVDRGTKLQVVSTGGREYAVTPFNFKMTQSQLVASDRDTLLMLEEVEDYEVQHLSTGKTVALISAGVVAVAGIIVATVITAGRKSFDQ
ncbi:MAG: hypothetical protein ACQEXJ_08670 [Myxococcota bacterium]